MTVRVRVLLNAISDTSYRSIQNCTGVSELRLALVDAGDEWFIKIYYYHCHCLLPL